MQIVEINLQNIEQYKQDLIQLNDDFLLDLDIAKERSQAQKEEILKNMIKVNSPTHLLAGIDDDDKMVGMAYFNEGTGYSCGGDYLWLNSIYIRPEEQKKGYGLAIINYIENWGKARGVRLFVSSRDIGNEKSKRLFEKGQFEQSENISINKLL